MGKSDWLHSCCLAPPGCLTRYKQSPSGDFKSDFLGSPPSRLPLSSLWCEPYQGLCRLRDGQTVSILPDLFHPPRDNTSGQEKGHGDIPWMCGTGFDVADHVCVPAFRPKLQLQTVKLACNFCFMQSSVAFIATPHVGHRTGCRSLIFTLIYIYSISIIRYIYCLRWVSVLVYI